MAENLPQGPEGVHPGVVPEVPEENSRKFDGMYIRLVVPAGTPIPETTPQASASNTDGEVDPEAEAEPVVVIHQAREVPAETPQEAEDRKRREADARERRARKAADEKFGKRMKRRTRAGKVVAGTLLTGLVVGGGTAIIGSIGEDSSSSVSQDQGDEGYTNPTQAPEDVPTEAIPSPREAKESAIPTGVEAMPLDVPQNLFSTDRLAYLQGKTNARGERIDIVNDKYRPYVISGINVESQSFQDASPLSELTLKTFTVGADGTLTYAETDPLLVIDKRDDLEPDQYYQTNVTFYIPQKEGYAFKDFENKRIAIQLEDKNQTAPQQPDVNVAVLAPKESQTGELDWDLLPADESLNKAPSSAQ